MSTEIHKTIKKPNGRKYSINIEMYTSAQEVANDCKTRPITNSNFQDYSQRLGNGTAGNGVKTYDEAIDLLRNGYQPIVESLKEELRLTNGTAQKRIKIHNDIVGFAPVVPLALIGVPQSMVNMTMRPIKAKVLNIYYDMTCASYTEPDAITETGRQLLSAIMRLEQQGYKFNLYGVQSYCDDTDADMLVVKIKASDMPLDLKRISFPLAHVAFFRVIGFDWYSRTPKGRYRSGYGRSLKNEFGASALPMLAKQIFGDTAIYISAAMILNDTAKNIQEAIINGTADAKR